MLPEWPSSPSEPVPLRAVCTDRAQPVPAVPVPFDQLPRPLTSLIGRDAEVAAARALLLDRGVRLLTFVGPGGVGKTRLALRVGEELAPAFADGVVFVPLAPIADPDLVLPTLAQALSLREVGAHTPASLVAEYLRPRRLLLVLDNVEQVQPAATQLATLLAGCPGVVMLVTSRVPLHVVGEQRFPVAPLALPVPCPAEADRPDAPPLAAIAASAAVQLFVDRAQAVDPRFALDTANAGVISAICRRLDGLPLSIELAAARTSMFSPTEVLALFNPALPLLTGGPEDAPDRLRTMRQAIAWSYDLLSDEEQALFRRLTVFVGGFTLEAAEAVGSRRSEVGSEPFDRSSDLRLPTSDSVLALVASLIDKSLLRRIEDDGDTRFGMLETIREFGLEQLATSGEVSAVSARHAAWYVHLAEEVWRSGRLSQERGLATLEAEHPNLRAALAWLLARGETPPSGGGGHGGEATTALHLAGLLAEFWLRHGHLAEGEAWLERALAADTGGPTAARAEALAGLNMLLWPRDDFARAEEVLREAETVARAADDVRTLAYVRLHRGYVASYRGDLDLAVAIGEEMLATPEAFAQGFGRHGALWLLAKVALARGQDERAAALYERLLAAGRAEDDQISLANGLYGLAALASRRGEMDRALTGFTEAAMVCRGIGDRLRVSACLVGAAATAVALARLEPAVRLFAAADALRTAVDAPIQMVVDERYSQEQGLAVARAALGAERFGAEWAAGAGLSLDEAISEATDLSRLASSPDPTHPAPETGLTPRETEVLRLVIAGWSDKEIAATLGIGRRTVSNHVAAIRAKLDAPSRTAAAAIAVRDHLV